MAIIAANKPLGKHISAITTTASRCAQQALLYVWKLIWQQCQCWSMPPRILCTAAAADLLRGNCLASYYVVVSCKWKWVQHFLSIIGIIPSEESLARKKYLHCHWGYAVRKASQTAVGIALQLAAFTTTHNGRQFGFESQLVSSLQLLLIRIFEAATADMITENPTAVVCRKHLRQSLRDQQLFWQRQKSYSTLPFWVLVSPNPSCCCFRE